NLLIRGSYAVGALAINCIPLSPFNLLIRGSYAVGALAINCIPLSPFNLLIRGSYAVGALAINCIPLSPFNLLIRGSYGSGTEMIFLQNLFCRPTPVHYCKLTFRQLLCWCISIQLCSI
ncbi:hypothetical protein, partial [Staphylococcus aureus]